MLPLSGSGAIKTPNLIIEHWRHHIGHETAKGGIGLYFEVLLKGNDYRDSVLGKNNIEKIPGIGINQRIGINQHREYVRNVLNCLYDAFNKAIFPPSFTKNFLGFLAAVHDVGKIPREFKAKCPAWLVMNGCEEAAQQGDWKNGLPHNEISQKALERFFKTHVQGQEEAKACWGNII